MGRHLVVGSGAIGTVLARRLANDGHDVLAISRSGRPSGVTTAADPSGLEWRSVDASDPVALGKAARGSEAIYNCANPRYHRWTRDWPPLAASMLAAARDAGAVLVTLSNLYGYGPVPHALAESDPLAAASVKGRVRAGMWHDALAAHRRGEVRATELRASDFYGPGATDQAALGSRVIPRILDHRTIHVLGDPDAPHSWTYTEDVVAALAIAGRDDRAWGRAWHVPTAAPLSTGEAVRRLSCVAGLPTPSVRAVPWSLVHAAGLLVPELRELREIAYQFDAPFVLDSRAFSTTFGLAPTPFDEGMARTLTWWRARRGFPLPTLEEARSRR